MEISLQRIIFEYNAFLGFAKSASTFVKRPAILINAFSHAYMHIQKAW